MEQTERERERWQGHVDATLKGHDASIASAHAKNDKLDAKEQLLELKVQTLATKIGLFASIGAFIGGGVMSVIVGFFFRH